MPTEPPTIKLPGTPKPWLNSAIMTMLRTPGLRSVLGRWLVILTVTGATTGKRYTTPVQYVRDGDRILVLSQRSRRWWRNLAGRPDVELVLRGDTIRTVARLADEREAPDAIATCLRLEPRIAKFYGIAVGEDGEPDPVGVEQLDAALVVIIVEHAGGSPP